MTREELHKYVEKPQELTEENLPQLQELVVKFPYFNVAHWLLLKTLKNSNSIYFGSELNKTSLYSPDRKELYFFIYPEEREVQRKKNRKVSDGSYFDMIEKYENSDNDNPNSLQSLVEKFRAARENLSSADEEKPLEQPQEIIVEESPKMQTTDDKQSFVPEMDFVEMEAEAKSFIKNKNYSKALEILNYLNLNNPKKSIYFADQIRFLEKIVNSKR